MPPREDATRATPTFFVFHLRPPRAIHGANRRAPVAQMSQPRTYTLGIDLSTQGLTCLLVSEGSSRSTLSFKVNFDELLPQFGTSGGRRVCVDGPGEGEGADGAAERVTAPVRMWVLALEALLKVLEREEWKPYMPSVAAISVSAQQHGSVYWTAHGLRVLEVLAQAQRWPTAASTLPLDALLSEHCFAVLDCPIWADSSSQAEADMLEREISPEHLAATTGSRAYARFTGVQIAALGRRRPDALWQRTRRISLVSSFVTSVLIGRAAPIDESDAGGTNLFDLSTRHWSPNALSAVSMIGNGGDGPEGAQRLRELLGPVAKSHQVVGSASAYLCSRLGLRPACAVVAGSGDNPCTLAGLGLCSDGDNADAAISLGTSDTLMALCDAPQPKLVGHVMASPIAPAPAAFSMLCYKNGGSVRDRLRASLGAAPGDWSRFDRAAQCALDGAAEAKPVLLAIVCDAAEITPKMEDTGTFVAWALPGGDVAPASKVSREELCAAFALSRFLSMRLWSQRQGLRAPNKVLVTGGGAKSLPLLQLIADVFGCTVEPSECTDGAALGAARRAAHGVACAADPAGFVSFAAFAGAAEEGSVVVLPRRHLSCEAPRLVEQYAKFEGAVSGGGGGNFLLRRSDEAPATEAGSLGVQLSTAVAGLGALAYMLMRNNSG